MLAALRDRRTLLPLVIGIVILLGLVVANAVFEFFPARRSRYFLILLPFAALVIGYGLAQLPRWHIILPITAVLWFVSGIQLHANPEFDLYTNRARYDFRDYPPFPETVDAFFRTGVTRTQDDVLFFVTNTPAGQDTEQPEIAEFYWRRLNISGRMIEPMTFTDDDQHPYYREAAEYVLSLQPMVVYLSYDSAGMGEVYHNALLTRLETDDYVECDPIEQSDNLYLEAFVREPAPCSILEAPNLDATYDEEPIHLLRYDVNALGNQLAVVTTWAMQGYVPPDTYSFSLRVVDAEGNYVAMHDQGIAYGTSSFGVPDGTPRRALTVFDTSDWAAGEYELRVMVYDWRTLAPLTGNLMGQSGVELSIDTFEYQPEQQVGG